MTPTSRTPFLIGNRPAALRSRLKVKRHTAWTIAADWWWLDKYAPRIVGGRKLWEAVTIPERGNQKRVRLWRLEGLKEFTRWVKPETRMELVLRNVELTDAAVSNAGKHK